MNSNKDTDYKKSKVAEPLESKKIELIKCLKEEDIVSARRLIKKDPCYCYCSLGSQKVKPNNKTMLRMLIEEFGEYFEAKTYVTSDITDMSMLFSGTTNILPENLSCLDVTNVENMSLMFYKSDIDLSKAGLENWDVSKVRNMRWMMEDTPENRRIVQAWKDKGLLNKVINENEIFYAKQKH